VSKRTQLLNNILFNWTGMALNVVISFFLAPFVVHKLGNLYYGIWVIMMQFSGYLGLLEFGVRESIIKYVARHRAEGDSKTLNELIGSAMSVYMLFALAALLVSGGVAAAFPYVFNVPPEAVSTARWVTTITGLTVALGFIANVLPGILMGLQRFDTFAKTSMVTSLLRVGLIVFFLSRGHGIITLALIQLFINLLLHGAIYAWCKHLVPDLRFSLAAATRASLRSIFKYSVLVLVNNMGQKAIFYTDAIVIGFFLPASQITFYAIAGTLVEHLRQFVMAMTRVFNPMISEMETLDEGEKIKRVLLAGGKFAFLFGLPVCTVFVLMGRRFIDLWMGPEYGELSGRILVILAITHLLALPHYAIGNVLYGLARHKVLAVMRTFEATANLVLSVILIQSLGLVGVALGTAITHVAAVVLILPPIACRIVGLPVVKFYVHVYLRTVLAGAPFAAACWLVDARYPAAGLAAFFGEVALMMPLFLLPVWFMAVDADERRQFLAYVGRMLPFKREE
jgi:O-antigen/teichoic acid export membrane protein